MRDLFARMRELFHTLGRCDGLRARKRGSQESQIWLASERVANSDVQNEILFSPLRTSKIDLVNDPTILRIKPRLAQWKGQVESQDKKVEQAERSLELSSTELAESNRNLFSMNLTMNAILNNLDQGLVVFDQTGQCSKFASKAAQKHFDLNFEDNDIPVTQLFRHQEADSIKDWVSILFDQSFDFKDRKSVV